MRMRTTIPGALAAALLLSACGGASDIAPAVEIAGDEDERADEAPADEPDPEPADDAEPAHDVASGDHAEAADTDEVADPEPSEGLSAPADDTSGVTVMEPDATSLADPCADHQDRSVEAFIELVAPVDEQLAGDEVELVGCSNVYEATVAWTLLDGDGRELDAGFTTAECGSGCVGEFRDTVSLSAAAGEPVAHLQVFSPNASDEGPAQLQLVEVILTIG